MYKKKKVPPLTICHYSSYYFTHYFREAFIEKKNYGKFHNQSDSIFWPKLWKILKNINYFLSSKCGLNIEINFKI